MDQQGVLAMQAHTLIVPGLGNSGPSHWQSWFEGQLPDARRVRHIDWSNPTLVRWAHELRREVDILGDTLGGPVWLVAHSFGCLASVVVAADRPDRVAGLLLVAPPDPSRFDAVGLRPASAWGQPGGLHGLIPSALLGVPSLLVASRNDPWASFECSAAWARTWGSQLVDLGEAGHINVDSGHGPWPEGLDLLENFQQTAHPDLLAGRFEAPPAHRGRGGVLARLRHQTRSLALARGKF
jgi:predicted alpha/beta hydrolase family esterase